MAAFSDLSEAVDVIVLGGGPTGLVLANLLGLAGVRTLVIERDADVFPVPRATHIDEETLRHFQLTGLMPYLEPYTSSFGAMQVLDADGRRLFQEAIAQPLAAHYYAGSRFFDQPAFERILRDGLARFPHVTLLAGVEADLLHQSADGVTVTAHHRTDGKVVTQQGRWLVGADGGRSLVRTALGIEMDSLEPPREWVIVDSLLQNPADAQLLPAGFRYLFAPERLTIFADGFGANKRWEFQLGKGEAMPAEAVVRGWVAQYIPLEKITITRIAKYAHNSLVAQRWRQQRIFLAGDAAHMMPPAAGQGMCSGVRDAVNLAWKLAAIEQGTAAPTLLDTYEQERKPHLHEILRRTLFFGSRLQADSAMQRVWRRVQLQAIEGIKPLKDYLRRTYNTPPPLRQGCLSPHAALAGRHLPQYELPDHTLTDDHLGYRWTLVARPGRLTAAQLQAAEYHGLPLLPPDLTTAFTAWLDQYQIDFAIVRPDKIVFGAGTATRFPALLAELAMFCSRAGAVEMAVF